MDEDIENKQDEESGRKVMKSVSPRFANAIRFIIILACSFSLLFSVFISTHVSEVQILFFDAWILLSVGFLIPLICLVIAYFLRLRSPEYNAVIPSWIFLFYNCLILIVYFAEFYRELLPGDFEFYGLIITWLLLPLLIFIVALITKNRNRMWYLATLHTLIPLVVVHIILFSALPHLVGMKRHTLDIRTLTSLRTLAKVQHDYAQKNNNKFGTWKDLQDQEFITQGYTRLNIIDNYSLAVFRVNNPSPESDQSYEPSFQIVSIPRSQKNKLMTFAICEDQHPRLWIGDESSFNLESLDLKNDDLWKPLR